MADKKNKMNNKYYIFNTSIGLFKKGGNYFFKEAQAFSLEEAKKIINGQENELEIFNEDQRKAIIEKDYLETMVYDLGHMLTRISLLNDRAEKVLKKCFVDYVNKLLDYYNPVICESIYEYYKVFARNFQKKIKEVKKDPNRLF